jgi:hypothetical protein
MNSALLAIVVALWLLCGILTYGGLFAHLQTQYPARAADEYRRDRSYAIIPSLFGPFGLLTVVLATRCFKYGFKFS